MPNALIEQMAARLGTSPEEARRALHALAEDVRAQARRTGEASLPGLGAFRHRGEHLLAFEPDAVLAQAANHRFEGLEPLTVAAPAETAPAPAVPATGDAGAAPPSVSPPAEPSTGLPAHAALRMLPALSTPVPLRSTPLEWGALANAALLSPSAAEPPPAPQPEVPAAPRTPATKETAAATRRSAFLPWTAGLLVLLIVAAGLWLALGEAESTDPATSQQSTADAREAPAEAPPPAADDERDPENQEAATRGQEQAAEAAGGASAEEEAEPPAADENPAPPEEADVGIDRAQGGWSIVVASRRSQAQVTGLTETYRERFAEEGLPVEVLESTADGATRYRLALGQFSSLTEAQAALAGYADRLPEGAWLLRLEPDPQN